MTYNDWLHWIDDAIAERDCLELGKLHDRAMNGQIIDAPLPFTSADITCDILTAVQNSTGISNLHWIQILMTGLQEIIAE